MRLIPELSTFPDVAFNFEMTFGKVQPGGGCELSVITQPRAAMIRSQYDITRSFIVPSYLKCYLVFVLVNSKVHSSLFSFSLNSFSLLVRLPPSVSFKSLCAGRVLDVGVFRLEACGVRLLSCFSGADTVLWH